MRATIDPAARLTMGTRIFRAALGYGGIRTGKQEGDGATPAGLLPLREVFYRSDRQRPPACAVLLHKLTPSQGWCDDPTHPAYNRPVHLPITGSAEALWRDDAVYDIIGILGWNDDPVLPGRGSAIFLHIARPGYTPTAGCIALATDDLIELLKLGLTEILVLPDHAT